MSRTIALVTVVMWGFTFMAVVLTVYQFFPF
jgi:hypothetical protein